MLHESHNRAWVTHLPFFPNKYKGLSVSHSRNNRGFTLTEIGIVLGIALIVVAAIWLGVSRTYSSYRLNNLARNLQLISRNVQNLTYPAPIKSWSDATVAYVAAGVFPSEMPIDTTGHPLTSIQPRGNMLVWNDGGWNNYKRAIRVSLYTPGWGLGGSGSMSESDCINMIMLMSNDPKGMWVFTQWSSRQMSTSNILPIQALTLCKGGVNDLEFEYVFD